MKVIANNGFYFSGKVRELIKELDSMRRKYKTLYELIKENRH